MGYLDDDCKIKPLHTMLLKKSTYVKRCDDKNKWMYFSIENDCLLKKFNYIWKNNCYASLLYVFFLYAEE